jgi:hypothetical protein
LADFEFKFNNITIDYDKLNGQYKIANQEIGNLKTIINERDELIGELNARVTNLGEDLRNRQFLLESEISEK